MAIALTTGFTQTKSSPGLRVTINPGHAVISGAVVLFPKQDVTLAANTTTYIYLNFSSGAIESSTSGFLNGAWPICTATTNSTDTGTVTDLRPDAWAGSGGTGVTPTGTGFTHITSGTQDAAAKLVDLAADTVANQGTTTTVLHGNAAGQPSFGAVSLTADVSGTLPLAKGGTNADLSASGSATAVLAQDASHVVTARSLIAADIPNLAASKITSGTLALAQGGTNADLSASGSTTAFLAQDASHVVTARSLVAADLPATAVTSASALTSNSVVLGAGGQGTKTAAGFTTDGTSALTVGAAGTGTGSVVLKGTTSGSSTLSTAATGALVNSDSGLAFTGASGAATTLSTTTTNANLILTPNGTGNVTVPAGASNQNAITFSGLSVGTWATASNLFLNVANSSGALQLVNGATQLAAITANSGGGTGPTFRCGITANMSTAIAGRLTTTVTQPAVVLGNTGTVSFTGTGAGTQIGVACGLGSGTTDGQLVFAPTSGTTNFTALQVNPQVNQTSTASGSYTGLLVNVVETALLGSSNKLLDLQAGTSGGVSRWSVLARPTTLGSDIAGSTLQSTANAATWTHGQASELLTLSTGGLTTDTTNNLLPAGAIIEAVVCRVTTTITTTTNWAVGDSVQSARFSSPNATLTSGTTSIGLNQADPTVATANLGPVQAAAAKVRITCTGSNPGAGVIRITVFYRQFVAPTS